MIRVGLITILVTLVSQLSFAQLFTKERMQNLQNKDKRRVSWGYYIGFNTFGYQFTYNEDKVDIIVDTKTNFNVGILGNLRINDYLDLRLEPGLTITERTLNYDPSYFEGIETTPKDLIRMVPASYIYIPLLIKASTKRINNFKPFIVGGFSTGFNLSSLEKSTVDNSSGVFRSKNTMFFYELGFGIDLYMYFFKFTPSIRGVFALNNEIISDVDPDSPWTGNVNTMKTRGVFINFTFQ